MFFFLPSRIHNTDPSRSNKISEKFTSVRTHPRYLFRTGPRLKIRREYNGNNYWLFLFIAENDVGIFQNIICSSFDYSALTLTFRQRIKMWNVLLNYVYSDVCHLIRILATIKSNLREQHEISSTTSPSVIVTWLIIY